MIISSLVGVCMSLFNQVTPYQEIDALKRYLPEGIYSVGGLGLTVSYKKGPSIQYAVIHYDDDRQTDFVIEGPERSHADGVGIVNKIRIYNELVIFTSVQKFREGEHITRLEMLFGHEDHIELKRLMISQRLTKMTERLLPMNYTLHLKSISGEVRMNPYLPILQGTGR